MELHNRKNIRLKDYDYSQNGAYFITICVKDKHEMLWDGLHVGARIARPPLTNAGEIVENAINEIPVRYPMMRLDKYIVMPNHLHMILIIQNGGRAMRAPTISTVVNQLKGCVTKRIGYSMWQKLFYDHIIRNEEEYLRIWQYIDENPAKWEEDRYFVRD